uniref:Uncharacterized protein n=1 Tax=viral metagenome TaxID=1070528 RepID=A0A2V0RA12_9ZZZZ
MFELIQDEDGGQPLGVAKDEKGLSIDMRSDFDFVEGHKVYKGLITGMNNLIDCINNPNKHTLNVDARQLLTLLSRLPKDEDERALFTREQLLIDKSERIRERLAMITSIRKSNDKLSKAREQRHASILQEQLTTEDLQVARNLIEEVGAVRESLSEISLAQIKLSVESTHLTAELDGVEKDMVTLRKQSYISLFDPTMLLMQHFGDKLDDKYENIPLDDKRRIKKAILGKVMTSLQALSATRSDTSGASRALFYKHSSVFKDTMEMEVASFMETEEARIIQQVYEMAVDLQNIREERQMQELRTTDTYSLTKSDVRVTRNPLILEMHILNLVTLAGYNPEMWANAFGLRTSGIAKQMLGFWGDRSTGPLTAEDIRYVFRGDRKPIDFGLDYTSLEFSVEVVKKKLVQSMTPKSEGTEKGESLPKLEERMMNPEGGDDA